MSTTTRQLGGRLRRALRPGRGVGALVVRWEISPGALVAAEGGAGVLNGHAASLRACALVWRVEAARATAVLVVELADGTSEELPLTAPRGVGCTRTVDAVGGLMCADAGSALRVTIDARDAERPVLLFARTDVLARVLGLPGGVYDPPVL